MISFEHKFIFVHVGRTGGSSFERMVGIDVTTHEATKELGNTDFEDKHNDFAYYQKNYPKEFAEFFKFTIVRNPFDRLVSRWFWQTKVVKNIPEMELAAFIKHTNYGHYSVKFKLEGFSIEDSIKQFDYIGRFEDLDSTYRFLSEKFNLPNPHVPHTNKTNHSQYQEYYTEEAKQLVREMYKDDLRLFKYDF